MSEAWTLKKEDDGFAWLTFDRPGEKVNSFTIDAMDELDKRIEQVSGDSSIKALVIVSGKKDSFIVGADIDELGQIKTEAEARAKAEKGQGVFSKIASLRIPTAAVINGACMGGGLEMSLACDYRIVSDDAKTSLALPEVNLGILPGWGGTQRLPRIVGLSQALTMILTGKTFNARKAYKSGLADGIVANEFMVEQVRAFMARAMAEGGRVKILNRRRSCEARMMRIMASNPLTRSLIFSGAHKQVMSKSKGQYPAPLEALDVVRSTYGRDISTGLPIEAAALGRLAVTPICKNLIRLFNISQDAKKGPEKGAGAMQRSAVVGAGAMGGGIAWALSNAGMTVRLKDINWDAIAMGTAAAAGMFKASVKRRKMKPNAMNVAMHRISGATDYSGFSNVDVVVEAVVENMDLKKRVLKEIEDATNPETIICTNTSSLPISELAEALDHPERFVGLHFFNPVNRMLLVEVIPGEKTSQATIDAAVSLVRRLGKTPIVAGECAGFLVNRILLPYIVEAARMFEEGVSAERIDQALEDFGMPMGPLTLADEVGLDVGFKVAKVLEDAYGPRMEVAPGLGRIVESGENLGKKTGRGFYIHSKKGKKSIKTANTEAERLARGEMRHCDLSDQEIVDRAVLVMVNEAARCIEEGVVSNPETLDMAMVFGTGFAPFRGGVLHYAEERGLSEITTRLRELAEKYGDRFSPDALLEQTASNGGHFQSKAAA